MATLLEKYVAAHVAAGWTEVGTTTRSHRLFRNADSTAFHWLGRNGSFRISDRLSFSSTRGASSAYCEDFLKRHLPADFVGGPSFQERVSAIHTRIHDENIDLFMSEEDFDKWLAGIMNGAARGQYREVKALEELDPTGDLLRFAKRLR